MLTKPKKVRGRTGIVPALRQALKVVRVSRKLVRASDGLIRDLVIVCGLIAATRPSSCRGPHPVSAPSIAKPMLVRSVGGETPEMAPSCSVVRPCLGGEE